MYIVFKIDRPQYHKYYKNAPANSSKLLKRNFRGNFFKNPELNDAFI